MSDDQILTLLTCQYYAMLLSAAGITTPSKWSTATSSPNSSNGSFTLLQLAQTMATYQLEARDIPRGAI